MLFDSALYSQLLSLSSTGRHASEQEYSELNEFDELEPPESLEECELPDGIDILDSLRNADLKDYCRDAIIDIDNSRFAKVDRPNGRCSIF